MYSVVSVLLFATILTTCQAATKSSDKDKLVRDLLKDYVKVNDPGEIKLYFATSFACVRIHEEKETCSKDESHSAVELTSRLLESYKWTDERLAWDPSAYGGVKELRLPAELIWTPDFKLYNNHGDQESRDDVNVVVYSDGTVLWIPPAIYKTPCVAEKNGYKCKIKIGSWTYNAKNIQLVEGENDPTFYLQTCPYTMKDFSMKIESKIYPCCPDDKYAHAEIEFKVQKST